MKELKWKERKMKENGVQKNNNVTIRKQRTAKKEKFIHMKILKRVMKNADISKKKQNVR